MYEKQFGYKVTAAGRVNIIGEHVDYCGGKVLPAALSLKNTVYVRPNGSEKINIKWTTLPDSVKELNRKTGVTIVMVLHDLNLAARYSHLLYAISDHALYAQGTPSEIITAENLHDIFEIEAEIFEDKINNCPYFIPLKTTINQGV